jgi:hypothetical protein
MINCKGCERKRSWPNYKVRSRNLPIGTEENHEDLNQDNRSLSRDLNLGPPENEARVLSTRSRRSI